MSHLVCYTVRMMIKEKLFKVNYKLTPKSTIVREAHVKAFDQAHAERIGARLYHPHPRGEVLSVEVVEGRFPRFDERKIGKFNR